MSRALLVCLSGIESSGKSTQLDRLVENARRRGLRPVCLWTRPGYTRNLEAAKRLVQRLTSARVAGSGSGAAGSERGPRAYPRRGDGFRSALAKRLWLSLALVDLIWVYGVEVRYWLSRGRTVICDRYLWDCLVDFRVNFPGDDVESGLLGRMLTALTPRPDVAFFLLISVEESLRRSEQRERRFRETEAVLQLRLEEYRTLADEFRWPVLDGQRPAEEVSEEIQSKIAATVRPAS